MATKGDTTTAPSASRAAVEGSSLKGHALAIVSGETQMSGQSIILGPDF